MTDHPAYDNAGNYLPLPDRLRRTAGHAAWAGSTEHIARLSPSALMTEAADEIERLRKDAMAYANVRLSEENDALIDKIERLRAVLKECSDDLAVHIEHHYARTLDYPSQRVRYDADMTIVLEARKLLADEQSTVRLVECARCGAPVQFGACCECGQPTDH